MYWGKCRHAACVPSGNMYSLLPGQSCCVSQAMEMLWDYFIFHLPLPEIERKIRSDESPVTELEADLRGMVTNWLSCHLLQACDSQDTGHTAALSDVQRSRQAFSCVRPVHTVHHPSCFSERRLVFQLSFLRCWEMVGKETRNSTSDCSGISSPGGHLHFALLLSCLIEFAAEEAGLVPKGEDWVFKKEKERKLEKYYVWYIKTVWHLKEE